MMVRTYRSFHALVEKGVIVPYTEPFCAKTFCVSEAGLLSIGSVKLQYEVGRVTKCEDGALLWAWGIGFAEGWYKCRIHGVAWKAVKGFEIPDPWDFDGMEEFWKDPSSFMTGYQPVRAYAGTVFAYGLEPIERIPRKQGSLTK